MHLTGIEHSLYVQLNELISGSIGGAFSGLHQVNYGNNFVSGFFNHDLDIDPNLFRHFDVLNSNMLRRFGWIQCHCKYVCLLFMTMKKMQYMQWIWSCRHWMQVKYIKYSKRSSIMKTLIIVYLFARARLLLLFHLKREKQSPSCLSYLLFIAWWMTEVRPL